MEFKIQDVPKNIIPGTLLWIYIIIAIYIHTGMLVTDFLPENAKDFSEICLMIFLTVVYLTGYMLDGISSFLEELVYIWPMKIPSYYLLNGGGREKLKLSGLPAIINILEEKYKLENNGEALQKKPLKAGRTPNQEKFDRSGARTLFRIANRMRSSCNENQKELITEYYNSYVFCRNIAATALMTFLFTLVLTIINIHDYWITFLTISSIFVFSALRWRQKAFYYSKIILHSCIDSGEKASK